MKLIETFGRLRSRPACWIARAQFPEERREFLDRVGHLVLL
jgi:hypothetical protein